MRSSALEANTARYHTTRSYPQTPLGYYISGIRLLYNRRHHQELDAFGVFFPPLSPCFLLLRVCLHVLLVYMRLVVTRNANPGAEKRGTNPDLQPTRFLWEPYGACWRFFLFLHCMILSWLRVPPCNGLSVRVQVRRLKITKLLRSRADCSLVGMYLRTICTKTLLAASLASISLCVRTPACQKRAKRRSFAPSASRFVLV